jgi:hypothetical protein
MAGEVVVGMGCRVDVNGRDVLLTATHVLKTLVDGAAFIGTTQTKVIFEDYWPVVFASSENDLDLALVDVPAAVWSLLGVRKLQCQNKIHNSDYCKVVGVKDGVLVQSRGTAIPWKSKPFYLYHASSTLPSFSGSPLVNSKNQVIGVHLGAVEGRNYGVCVLPVLRVLGSVRETYDEDTSPWKSVDYYAGDWENSYKFKMGKRDGTFHYSDGGYQLEFSPPEDDDFMVIGWNEYIVDLPEGYHGAQSDLRSDFRLETPPPPRENSEPDPPEPVKDVVPPPEEDFRRGGEWLVDHPPAQYTMRTPISAFKSVGMTRYTECLEEASTLQSVSSRTETFVSHSGSISGQIPRSRVWKESGFAQLERQVLHSIPEQGRGRRKRSRSPKSATQS